MAFGQGLGIVWGLSTTGFNFTGAGTVHLTGQDWGREGDLTEVKGQDGRIKTAYFTNKRHTLSVKCFPSGGTMAGNTADPTATPDIGEKVTIVDADDADLDGDWCCESVSKTKSSEGHCEFTVGLRQWDAITIA